MFLIYINIIVKDVRVEISVNDRAKRQQVMQSPCLRLKVWIKVEVDTITKNLEYGDDMELDTVKSSSKDDLHWWTNSFTKNRF